MTKTSEHPTGSDIIKYVPRPLYDKVFLVAMMLGLVYFLAATLLGGPGDAGTGHH